jgi:serine/threonine protein kinase
MALPSFRPECPTHVRDYELVRELAAHPVPTYEARKGSARFIIERLGKFPRKGQIGHLVRLRHPNLACVHEVIEDENGVTVASEFIDGVRFGQLANALALDAKLRIAVDLLNGLSALHGHRDLAGKVVGLFHGDVSPSSVLVGVDGTARLVHLALPRTAVSSSARGDLRRVAAFLVEALRRASADERQWASTLIEALKPGFATAAEMSAQIRSVARAKMAPAAKVAACVRALCGRPSVRPSEALPSRSRPPLAAVTTPKTPEPPPPAAIPESGTVPRAREAWDTHLDYEPYALSDVDAQWDEGQAVEPPAPKRLSLPDPDPRDTVSEFPEFLEFVASACMDDVWANA